MNNYWLNQKEEREGRKWDTLKPFNFDEDLYFKNPLFIELLNKNKEIKEKYEKGWIINPFAGRKKR